VSLRTGQAEEAEGAGPAERAELTGRAEPESVDFDGLTIRFDDRVLRPRAWTAEQSRWAASLLPDLPDGAVLELCAGAGQIGLAAVSGSPRRLVCVEADPVAAAYAVLNAEAAGCSDRVQVREAPMARALQPGERFPLIVADPPWVRRTETGRFPEDPLTAIDGGDDGLDVARECVALVGGHLAAGGAALLQLGSADQVGALRPELGQAGLIAVEVRRYERGVVALVRSALDDFLAHKPASG
jgi:release factor glutamine methyltransferase